MIPISAPEMSRWVEMILISAPEMSRRLERTLISLVNVICQQQREYCGLSVPVCVHRHQTIQPLLSLDGDEVRLQPVSPSPATSLGKSYKVVTLSYILFPSTANATVES